jgi:hypothetical protein
MNDRRTDPNPDSPPRDEDRGSIESLDRPAPDRDSEEGGSPAPEPANGSDGIVKNQDDMAQ